MRGKVGLVIGLAAGYVLGTRAGRERYEQIKTQVEKVWNLDPVQEQVGKVKDFAKSTAMALPSTLWDTAKKVTKAASSEGTTPGQRLDAALKTSKEQADDVRAAADTSARAVKDAAEETFEDISEAVGERNGA
ncbi:YtxH domain-containing protein [Microbacterium sp. zg.B48]|uniref:YtxH domain-containing protein n=1 Tax=unclassified Microbacterium TaxID=2609290 RepID=UPI00214B5229|nr:MULTISPECIES: YtxH domain-containing protein [unclassified Microbacterium]MCR2762986.1 YtxH domain-containing protein [Microbacterium sp. zg.B48]MCR2808572.1 YtxH domain-containing protein [Microbacterium sp. zg.B185]WIM18990.1 YtxH domain-containing protein [Microbacterium sp. zg-B185]